MGLHLRSIFALFLLSHVAMAQVSTPWHIGGRVQYGQIWPHKDAIWIMIESHALAFEVFGERHVRGSRSWHHLYRMPRYGFALLGTDAGAPDKVGYACRLIPYLRLPLIQGAHTSLGLRLGWGLGWVKLPYHEESNNKQIAIGSQLNTAIQMMLEVRRDWQRLGAHAGLSVDHWSNGAWSMPNLGINLLTVNMGVSYAFGTEQVATAVPDTVTWRGTRPEFCVILAGAANSMGQPDAAHYPVVVITGDVRWRVSPKVFLSTGPDLFNKGSLVQRDPELEGEGPVARTQFGVHGGAALGMGRGELLFQPGVYLYTPAPDEGRIYSRIGCRYRTGRHWIWNISLKSHRSIADHWEFGMGYRWN